MKKLLFLAMMVSMISLAQNTPEFNAVSETGLTATFSGSLDCADVDHDGNIDCLQSGYTEYTPMSYAIRTSLSFGNGDGTFTNVDIPVPNLSDGCVKFFDANHDGNPDIFAFGVTEDEFYAGIFLGDGARGFTYSAELSQNLVGLYYANASFATIDGQDYIITTGQDVNGQIRTITYRNDNDVYVIVPTIFENVRDADVAMVDINNDGHVDVVIVGQTGSSNIAKLYINNGTGNFSFTSVANVFVPSGQSSIAVSDINNDGYVDFAIMGARVQPLPNVLDIYINNQNATFTKTQSFPGLDGGELIFAKIDNDEFSDMFAVGTGDDGYFARLYLNDQTGNMTLNQEFEPGVGGASAAVNDFNNDDVMDIMYTGVLGPFGDGALQVLLQDATANIGEFRAESVKMYPNPTRDIVNVEIPNNLTDFTVSVVDVVGRNISIILVDGQFDISYLVAGTYFVTVHSDGRSVTKRIIKQ